MHKPKISGGSRIHWFNKKRPAVENTQGKKPTGRNVGKLMQIMNVPVEVFLEIVSYLHPLDLLQLSRASNELRDTLMSKQKRGVWASAIKSIVPTMPDCPDDISEPRYVSLIFERNCMACGVGRASAKVSYAVYVRFCAPCWKANVESGRKLAKKLGLQRDKELMNVIFNLLPEAREAGRQYRVYEVHQQSYNRFYEPEFVAVVDQYKESRTGRGGVPLQQFLANCQGNTLARLQFAAMVTEWESDLCEAKVEAANQIRDRRRTAIEAKLRELGYEKTDYPQYNYGLKKMLDQARELTPRVWNTIRPKLIAILDAERAQREAAAFTKTWGMRREELNSHYKAWLSPVERAQNTWKRTLPNFTDALKLPCMATLLTANGPNEPITAEQFAAIQPSLVQEAETYRARVWRDLADLLRASAENGEHVSKRAKTSASATSDDEDRTGATLASHTIPDDDSEGLAADLALLNLPTSIFVCRSCSPSDLDVASSDGVLTHWQTAHPTQEWGGRHIISAAWDLRQVMPTMLEVLGLPANTTLGALDEFVGMQRGEPVCACATQLRIERYCYRKNTVLGLVADHIRGIVRYGDATMSPKHHITFDPATPETSLAAQET